MRCVSFKNKYFQNSLISSQKYFLLQKKDSEILQKCVFFFLLRCGKLFNSTLEVEFHATKSGHDQFSESTEMKKPLTDEEKREKLKQLEEKLKEKRKEREEKEKHESFEKEKHRIRSGKEMSEARKK